MLINVASNVMLFAGFSLSSSHPCELGFTKYTKAKNQRLNPLRDSISAFDVAMLPDFFRFDREASTGSQFPYFGFALVARVLDKSGV